MFQFQVDARDNYSGLGRECNFCCAEKATSVPGEKNPWMIDYSPWLIGIRGRGLCQPITFAMAKLTANPTAPFPSDLPPTNVDYTFSTPLNTALSSGADVSTSAVSPGSHTMTFAVDPINPPLHGTVAMNSNGSFIYVPNVGYSGLDQFTFLTMDGVNLPISNQVTIKIPSTTALPVNQGLLYVDPRSVCIRSPFLTFKVSAAPEAIVGQVYRLTIAATAMDCDADTSRHISTYDIVVTKCGF